MSHKTNPTSSKGANWSILVPALLTFVAAVIVGYWQFVLPKQDTKEDVYEGRVISSTTEQPIRGGKVTLDISGVPSVDFTDSNGAFRFPVLLKGNNTYARIHVEAAGYDKFDQLVRVSLSSGFGLIRLQPLNPTPTNTPTIISTTQVSPNPTVTATQSPTATQTETILRGCGGSTCGGGGTHGLFTPTPLPDF